MKLFRYLLRKQPASFDFVTWLVNVMSEGCERVMLDTSHGFKSKGNEWNSEERMNSIVYAVLNMFHIPYAMGDEGGMYSHSLTDAIRAHKENRLWKLPIQVEPAVEPYVTMTIRHWTKSPSRNTSDEWRRAGEAIGALIIEDYYDQPITLTDRVELYRRARMNYVTNGGPWEMLIFSECPYRAFKVISTDSASELNMKRLRINRGFQFPWRVPGQEIIWEPDSYKAVMREHDKLISEGVV